MARSARTVSSTGLYHVMARSNGRQFLFDDDDDRRSFLETMQRCFQASRIVLIAWCLMENHVHLVVREDGEECGEALSRAMHALLTSYAKYYNKKTGHVGHVFQGRYGSRPIEDLPYLLQVVRYVHGNPEHAFICPASAYPWSSYHEYVGKADLCDTSVVLEEVNGVKGFLDYSNQPRDESDFFPRFGRVPDDEALDVAVAVLDGMDPRDIKSMPKAQRDEALQRLRKARLTVKQIVRLTGIGYTTVSQATKRRTPDAVAASAI